MHILAFLGNDKLDDTIKNPKHLEISAVHDECGYREIRQILSDQYNLSSREPNIEVWSVDTQTRTLILRHTMHNGVGLDKKTLDEVVRMLYTDLWGHQVVVEQVDGSGSLTTLSKCPSK